MSVSVNAKVLILPVVLYWYETWSLTLRQKHRFMVSETRVLRRIFGCKREEVAGRQKIAC
jgi:hypothetical protein